MEEMMRRIQVYSGIILALVLLYYSPVFAGDKFGTQGMFSAGDMKTSIKSGGTFTSQSNIINSGTQVKYGGDERALSAPIANANTATQLNAKGYSAGPGGTVIPSGGTNAAGRRTVVAVPGAEDTSHDYADPFIPETSSEIQANTKGNVASSPSDGLTLFRQDPNAQTGNTEETVVVSRKRAVSITHGNEKKKGTGVDAPLDFSH
jgi:hypothetical protein